MTVPSNTLSLTTNPYFTKFGAMTVTHHTLPNRVHARLAGPQTLTQLAVSEPGLFIQLLAAIRTLSERVNEFKPTRKNTRKPLQKNRKGAHQLAYFA